MDLFSLLAVNKIFPDYFICYTILSYNNYRMVIGIRKS